MACRRATGRRRTLVALMRVQILQMPPCQQVVAREILKIFEKFFWPRRIRFRQVEPADPTAWSMRMPRATFHPVDGKTGIA